MKKYKYQELDNIISANELCQKGWKIVFIKFFDSGRIANIILEKINYVSKL